VRDPAQTLDRCARVGRYDDERMLADLPAAMGAAEFQRARSAGQAMPPNDAVAMALAHGA
jgi:hypothetical protein